MSRFAFDPVTSPVLQQVLAVVGKIASDGQETVQELTNLPQRILGLDHESEGRSPFVEKLLRDPVGSHLLQKIIQQLDGPSFHRLYLAYFRNRLEELSAHPLANFVVQELAAGAKTKIELEMMIDELGPHWPKLLCESLPRSTA